MKILNASRVQRNDPTRFTFMTDVKSSIGISSIGYSLSVLPAFFTSQSAKERKKKGRSPSRQNGTYVQQQVEPANSVDRLLKEALDECFVGDVTVDDETPLGIRTGSFCLLQLGQTSCRQR